MPSKEQRPRLPRLVPEPDEWTRLRREALREYQQEQERLRRQNRERITKERGAGTHAAD